MWNKSISTITKEVTKEQIWTVDFGMAKAILNFHNATLLTFTITERDGNVTNETETVEIKLTEIRPQLFMATWKEINGNTITKFKTLKMELYIQIGLRRPENLKT